MAGQHNNHIFSPCQFQEAHGANLKVHQHVFFWERINSSTQTLSAHAVSLQKTSCLLAVLICPILGHIATKVGVKQWWRCQFVYSQTAKCREIMLRTIGQQGMEQWNTYIFHCTMRNIEFLEHSHNRDDSPIYSVDVIKINFVHNGCSTHCSQNNTGFSLVGKCFT